MLAKPPSASVWLTKELVGDTATVLAKFHFTAVLIVKGAIAYNNELKIYEKYFWRCQRAGKNACSGDSGGPLVVPKSPYDNTAVIFGIASWVMGDDCSSVSKIG